MGRKPTDLTGQKFSKLTALRIVGSDPVTKHAMWLCKCDCGNEVVVKSGHLMAGDRKSCGCTGKRGERKRSEEERQRLKEVNGERGVPSLCWKCIRSASPESLQCIWDKTKGMQMPEGATGRIVGKTDVNSKICGADIVKIDSCPEFLDMADPENMALFKAEREKAKLAKAKEVEEQALATSGSARTNNNYKGAMQNAKYY